MLRLDNVFLDFYVETAERLLRQNQDGMPAQFIGPKLFAALHNVCQLPVMESAGMLSPLVIKDLVQGRGEALRCFLEHSPAPIAGANLCIFSHERQEVSREEMGQIIDLLTGKESGLLPFHCLSACNGT